MMPRTFAVAALILTLGVLVAFTVRIETDARELLGEAAPSAEALETRQGLRVIGAITGGTAERRAEIARDLAASFADTPLIERIETGPGAPSAQLIDILWQHRLTLAPPPNDAFTREALTEELRRAKAGLRSLSSAPVAPRFLSDPTGSFRRLIGALSSPPGLGVDVVDSGYRSTDGTAEILFVQLARTPFEAAAQAALDAQMQAFVAERGAELTLVGLRSISARISGDIETRAHRTALVGSGLVLLWMVIVFRGIRGLGALLLPVASAFAVALLSTQILFGGVHVIALGFGGALLGLAVDYPLHLMTHAGANGQRQRALGLIGLGALTTAAAFLSLLGAGLEIMAQIGVFAASGLLAAALTCHAIARSVPAIPLRLPSGIARLPHLRGKLVILAGASLVLGGLLIATPPQISQRLTQIPAPVRANVATMDDLLGLPSGQFGIETTASDMATLLDLQARLAPVLGRLEAEGALSRFMMLIDILPARSHEARRDIRPTMQANIAGALADAGLAPAFAADIMREYDAASATPPLSAEIFAAMEDQSALFGLIGIRGAQLVGRVQLWDVQGPDRIAAAISAMDDAEIRWVAPTARIAAHLSDLTRRAITCIAMGGIAGLILLLFALRGRRAAVEIALTGTVAVLATTTLIALTGGLGIFHVLALVLVIGIGIDYGLFLATCRDRAEVQYALGSVLLCAVTTALAFGAMALSGVEILEDIAITVLSGLVLTLLLYGIRSDGGEKDT